MSIHGEAQKPLSQDDVVRRLRAALQAVQDPSTYGYTGQDVLARDRANLADYAKAMTGLLLFLTEGLIRAQVRAREKGICHVPSVIHNAWLRWLQLHGRKAQIEVPMDGWLVQAFPTGLLVSGFEVLEVLAASEGLGQAPKVSSRILLPPDVLAPVELFADGDDAWAERNALEVAAIVSADVHLGPPAELAIAHNSVAAPVRPYAPVTMTPAAVVDELALDLWTAVHGGELPWLRYPGH